MNYLWVKNTSKKNVSLRDLNITIPAGKSVNLLDNKHYNFTELQVQKSIESGSIYLKRNMIRVLLDGPAKVLPKKIEVEHPFSGNGESCLICKVDQKMHHFTPMIKTPRSTVKIEQQQFDELLPSDEQYVNDFVAMEELIWNPAKKK